MAKHVKRSVVPIYLVGVVWLVFALFFSLHEPADYLVCVAVSVAAFVVGKAIFPDKPYQMPGEEQPKQEKTQDMPLLENSGQRVELPSKQYTRSQTLREKQNA